MNLSFQVEKWSLVVEELKPLIVIQHAEIALDKDIIPLDPDWERYASWDALGALVIVTVRDGTRMVGWHWSLKGFHPHYKSTLFGMQDLYYLLPEYRSMPTIGLRMFMTMEKAMKEMGVVALIGNTKEHLDRSPLFMRLGWRRTGTLFTKVLI